MPRTSGHVSSSYVTPFSKDSSNSLNPIPFHCISSSPKYTLTLISDRSSDALIQAHLRHTKPHLFTLIQLVNTFFFQSRLGTGREAGGQMERENRLTTNKWSASEHIHCSVPHRGDMCGGYVWTVFVAMMCLLFAIILICTALKKKKMFLVLHYDWLNNTRDNHTTLWSIFHVDHMLFYITCHTKFTIAVSLHLRNHSARGNIFLGKRNFFLKKQLDFLFCGILFYYIMADLCSNTFRDVISPMNWFPLILKAYLSW